MAFVQTVFWHTMVEKISDAKNSVHIALPSIDEPLSDLLVTLKQKNVQVNVCIDNSEEAIRNGYGDEKAIDNLIENKIALRESIGNKISFIIIDNVGLIIFPESRIFSNDPNGTNAIELDAFTITRLIAHFFPPENNYEKEKLKERFDESYEAQKDWIDKLTSEVNEGVVAETNHFKVECYNKAKESFKINPPISPDLERQIKTYTAKIQFVELKFTGINLESRTIKIPKDAIPIDDGDLKDLLFTKIKLFQNLESNKGFDVFRLLKKKIELLRDDYLKPITCREGKSLIQIEKKEKFKDCLEKLKIEIQDLNKHLPDILETAIFETKDLIKQELLIFYNSKPPKEIEQFNVPSIKDRKLNEYVDSIVYGIHFPKTEKLIENLSLRAFYYDLTFQDFSDVTFIQELSKKEIMRDEEIEGIVEMKNAFEERK